MRFFNELNTDDFLSVVYLTVCTFRRIFNIIRLGFDDDGLTMWWVCPFYRTESNRNQTHESARTHAQITSSNEITIQKHSIKFNHWGYLDYSLKIYQIIVFTILSNMLLGRSSFPGILSINSSLSLHEICPSFKRTDRFIESQHCHHKFDLKTIWKFSHFSSVPQ